VTESEKKARRIAENNIMEETRGKNSRKERNVHCVRGYEKLSVMNFGRFASKKKKIVGKEN